MNYLQSNEALHGGKRIAKAKSAKSYYSILLEYRAQKRLAKGRGWKYKHVDATTNRLQTKMNKALEAGGFDNITQALKYLRS